MAIAVVIARRVLQSQDVQEEALALSVASFLIPRPLYPSWKDLLYADDPIEAEVLHDIQWLQTHAEEFGLGVPSYRLMDRAARHGFLSVVRFLHEHRREGCSFRAMNKAAKYGHLDVVRFLHEHRHEGCSPDAVHDAAAYGHLAVVQYLIEEAQAVFHDEALHWATLEVLQYFHLHVPRANPMRSSRVIGNAVVYGHMDIVEWYYACRPERCLPENLVRAVECGNVNTVKFVLQHTDMEYPRDLLDRVAGYGDIEMVRLLHEDPRNECSTVAMDAAAANGALDVVRFLHEHRTEGCTSDAMDEAAAEGYIDVVRYLHEHRTEGCTTRAMDYAVKGKYPGNSHYTPLRFPNGPMTAGNQDHFAVVRYLNEHRSEGCTKTAMDVAAENGDLELVRYLREHRTEGCSINALYKAAANRHLEVVQFLHENRTEGCKTPMTDLVMTRRRSGVKQFACELHEGEEIKSAHANILQAGDLDVIRYLYEHRVMGFSPWMLSEAAKLGFCDLVAYLVESCLVDAIAAKPQLVRYAIERAAFEGHVHILQYFDSKKPAPSHVYITKAMDQAAARGHYKVVKYLHFHGHEGCTTAAMDSAAANGSWYIVRFLSEYRSEGCTTKAMDKAAANGHLDVVRYLHEHRSEGCTVDAIDQAAANGHVEVVKFLVDHRTEGHSPKAIQAARKNRHVDILALLPDYSVPWKYPDGKPGQ